MKLRKSFDLAINLLVHSKLRSWLTIIGIIIGIAAVVAIVSMSEGAQKQLEERLNSFGADVLTISPGASRARGVGFGGENPFGGGESSSTAIVKNLTSKDIMVLKSLSNIKAVMGTVSGTADISFSGKTASNTRCTGIDIAVWKEVTTETLSSGRLLTNGDVYSVVIGANLEKTFDKEIPINSKLIINGKSFNVVGILEEGSGIYLPLDSARTILDDVRQDDSFDSISVKIITVSLSNETVTAITKRLMLSHGILEETKKDFSVSNPAIMQETIKSTMNSMALFLGAIAAISLLVGAIGIANTMFTSVLEKTGEIGLMKAIGARNRTILSIFLFNSGLIGLVGGLGGIVLGFIASTAISTLSGISSSGGGPGAGGMMGSLFSSTYVSPQIIFGALLISILVGMVAGLIPAYRASKLNPVDALRWE